MYFVTKSPEETFDAAVKLGKELRGGEIILFTGGLGSGKTLFTKGILAGLDFDPDEVTSPSFALVNQYPARHEVFHIDLWRLEGKGNPRFAVGLDEIIENPENVVIIEWSERLGPIDTEREVLEIKIEDGGGTTRKFAVTAREDDIPETAGIV